MSRKHFKCWCADQGNTFEDGWMYSEGWYEEDAVQEFCDRNFYEWESPQEMEITVCEVDALGNRIGPDTVFDVTVDYSPNFYATARPTPEGAEGEKP